MSDPSSLLRLDNLRLMVHLGCTAQERNDLQPVDINIWLKFAKSPKACTSDSLVDTICYDKLSQNLKATVRNKNFCLIEHLTQVLYDEVKSQVGSIAQIRLRVQKIRTPVCDLRGPVSFILADF